MKLSLAIRPLLVLLGCFLLGGLGHGADDDPEEDLVRNANGKEYRGQVVFDGKDYLVLRSNTRLMNISKADQGEVRAVLRDLPKALAKLRQLIKQDAAGHLALAQEMQATNLPLEARLLFWRVLTLDPQNAVAHRALKHRLVADEWKARAGNGWLKLPKLKEYHAEWDKAWEFETSHFQLRSNMPLRETLTAALDLEYTYANFHALFGERLEVHASDLKIGVWLHGDGKSYNDPHQQRGGYYAERDRRLYVDATLPDWRKTLVHEAVHGIVDFAASHAKSGSGKIPGWLHESLALYMEPHTRDGSYSDEPRAIGGSGPIRWLIEHHAQAQRPYSLKAILNMPWADFGLTQRRELRYAQAYSLTYFCLNAEDGKYRDAFFNYARAAFEGKSSSTDFKKALGMREKELEATWTAYVKAYK